MKKIVKAMFKVTWYAVSGICTMLCAYAFVKHRRDQKKDGPVYDGIDLGTKKIVLDEETHLFYMVPKDELETIESKKLDRIGF